MFWAFYYIELNHVLIIIIITAIIVSRCCHYYDVFLGEFVLDYVHMHLNGTHQKGVKWY